jgi:hypothetical protein
VATRTISNAGGNWNATGTWVEGAVPTASDDVVATATSGNLTINAAASCRSIDLTNYTGTVTHNAAISLSIGTTTTNASNTALVFPSTGWTYTLGNSATSALVFASTSATQQTIDFGGKTVGNVTFNGAGSSYLLSSAMNSSGTLTLNAGTFNSNAKNVTASVINTNTGTTTRVLTLTNSTVTLTGSGVNAFDSGNPSGSNLTINATGSTVNMTGASAIFKNGYTFGTLNLQAANQQIGNTGSGASGTYTSVNYTGGGNMAMQNGTFTNLTVTGTAAKTDNILIRAITVTGTLTINGNSASNRLLISSDIVNTQRVITLQGAGANVVASNVDFMDVGFAQGTGGPAMPINLSAISGGAGDAGGNSNITFSASQTNYWVADTGNWSDSTKWKLSDHTTAGRVPLPQDDVRFDASSFTATGKQVTTDMPRVGRNVDFTGVTNSPTLVPNGTGLLFMGSLTMVSGMTQNTTVFTSYTFGARSTAITITSAGKTLPGGLTLNLVGGSLTLQDALNSNGAIIHNFGTFDAVSYNVTGQNFQSNNSNTRSIKMGSGTWTLWGDFTIWNTATQTNLTFNAGTSTLVISSTSGSGRTFTPGGGLTFYNLTITGGGTGSVTIQSASTFHNLVIGAPKTVIFPSSTTQTITGIFDAVGSSGNVITIQASTSGTAATLSKASGIAVANYLSLKDSTATGGATWYAGANSTTVSNVTGWTMTNPPTQTENMTARASVVAYGSPHLTSNRTMTLTAKGSAVAYGATHLTPPASLLTLTSRATVVAFGSPTLKQAILMNPVARGSVVAFGTASLTPGAVTLHPPALSAGVLGAAHLSTLRTVFPNAVLSAQAEGAPHLLSVFNTHPVGLASSRVFGQPHLFSLFTFHAIGKGSSAAPGLAHLLALYRMNLVGVVDPAQLGVPHFILSKFFEPILLTAEWNPQVDLAAVWGFADGEGNLEGSFVADLSMQGEI